MRNAKKYIKHKKYGEKYSKTGFRRILGTSTILAINSKIHTPNTGSKWNNNPLYDSNQDIYKKHTSMVYKL